MRPAKAFLTIFFLNCFVALAVGAYFMMVGDFKPAAVALLLAFIVLAITFHYVWFEVRLRELTEGKDMPGGGWLHPFWLNAGGKKLLDDARVRWEIKDRDEAADRLI